jgi:hypothetical protein
VQGFFLFFLILSPIDLQTITYESISKGDDMLLDQCRPDSFGVSLHDEWCFLLRFQLNCGMNAASPQNGADKVVRRARTGHQLPNFD